MKRLPFNNVVRIGCHRNTAPIAI